MTYRTASTTGPGELWLVSGDDYAEALEGEWQPDGTFKVGAHNGMYPVAPGDVLLGREDTEREMDVVESVYTLAAVYVVEVKYKEGAAEQLITDTVRRWWKHVAVTDLGGRARLSSTDRKALGKVITDPLVADFKIIRMPDTRLDLEGLLGAFS